MGLHAATNFDEVAIIKTGEDRLASIPHAAIDHACAVCEIDLEV